MKFRAGCLLTAALLVSNTAAADCIASKRVPIDTFMNHSLSVNVPLDVLVPADYERAALDDIWQTYSYWMPPAMVADARRAKNLPTATGYMYGKISLDAGYDPASGTFKGTEAMESAMAAAGYTDIHSEREKPNGHAVLFFDALKDGRRLYSMYVALNVETNAVYVSYVAPSNNGATGECFWKDFKAAVLQSEVPASADAAGAASAKPPGATRSALQVALLGEAGNEETLIATVARLAAAKDVDGLARLFSAASSNAAADGSLRSFLTTEVLPFFADTKRVDSYSSVNGASFPGGTVGSIYYTYIETAAGTYKPFTIALRQESDGLKVMSLQVNKCVPYRHPVSAGRCDK